MTTTITAQHVLDLYNAEGFDRATLTDHDGQVEVVERVTARAEGWPCLAYQGDLLEEYPSGMTVEQAQPVADLINEQRNDAFAAPADA